MTEPILNREQSRRLDQLAQDKYGIAGVVLMENAGRGVADSLMRLGPASALSLAAICCGKGNNGGDGFVIARHLDLRGIPVRVLLFAEPEELSGDALINFEIIERSGLAMDVMPTQASTEELSAVTDEALAGATWIVDALLGTGVRGNPRPPYDTVIETLNRHPAPILAVDLPSGFDADAGNGGPHTIQAAHTCTFVARKPGFLVEGAKKYTGDVEVCDIGAPCRLIEEVLAEDG